MEAIFRYVLDQFNIIYQLQAPVEIYYGLNNTSRIQIKAAQTAFFQNTSPFPDAPPVYYTWKNQKIPFWFESLPTEEIITLINGKAIIQVDIIANAFYFLSGWQEYYSAERDQYGRFPYRASLQHQYNFITLPVVNYYFDILKTAIEQVYGITLKSVLADNADFTTCLTHDVDNCQTAWLVEGMQALRKGKFLNFLNLLSLKVAGKDNWFNVPAVMQTVQQYGAQSTFFFLANNRKHQGIANADYDVTQALYQKWLTLLQRHNFEIGVHGSHITALEPGKLAPEKLKIKARVRGNRFHYLRFEPLLTPTLMDEAQLAYDSTLGFSEHFGFRHGTCFPFRLFNFKTQQSYSFLEIPLHLMDATLHHPKYLQLTTDEILPAIKPMLQEIKKFGGCFTWLWHNENFSQNNGHNGPAAFKSIMAYLQEQQANFKTTGRVYDLLQPHRPD
ncbi:hypothetical protein HUW51_16205 [Adhaeribacter swui]|uniref:DUF7033 domain-containing protein n=1 Tax=Adhaeribacter swui TaxID=2086471 RepID=A0A7G7GAK5_9BACT|nr:polysaccharide deacetylase family protein [Adhaeribacter swui]QNF34189.1 hypothetical protein HUW51_16205 [Adhaeribacter swui]